MNIMKTNMLLLDNKIMKDESGNTTTVEVPVPSSTEPQAGMKALSFLGMKNLMANPKLAQGVGVMNEKVAEKSSADSYVAPYSSNLAFKGGLQNAAKSMAVLALVGMAAGALQSCEKDLKATQEQTVIIDTKALAAAITNGIEVLKAQIESLKEEIAALKQQQSDANNAQAERDQQMINALLSAISQLQALNDKVEQQNISFDEFKYMIYGQNSAILDAIVTLQGITKEEAQAAVDRILNAYKEGMIDIKTAMAQIQELLKTNNELLSEIVKNLEDLKAAADKAAEQREKLLGTADEINKNGKASLQQQQMMIAELGLLIQQNSIQIFNQQQTIKAIKDTGSDLKATIYEVANDLGVRVDKLAEVIAVTGKSIEEVMTMSKQEILAVLEAHLAELQTTNNKLVEINENISNVDASVQDNTGAIVNAAAEIKEALNEIISSLEYLKDAADKAAIQRDALLSLTEQIRKNGKISNQQQQTMIAELGMLIQQNNIQILNQQQTIKAIKDSKAELKASIYDVAKNLNINVDKFAEALTITGKSIEEVMKMSKEEILAALEANLAELQTTNNKLITINDNITNVDGSVQDNTDALVKAASDINAALSKISAQLDALSQQFADAVKLFKGKLDKLTYFAQGIFVNGQINNSMLAGLNGQIFDLRNDVKNIKATAIQIRDNIKEGVAIDYDQFKEMFNSLNMSQQQVINASTEEIVAKLDKFIDGQNKLEVAINKLGDENNSKLDYIASLIKVKTTDNADVIEAINNLAKSNETNITEATEILADKIDKLTSKVDAILNNMGSITSMLKQYGDQLIGKFDLGEEILAAIKANGAKLDINNMTLAELKAELEKIKPEIEKLKNQAITANSYLDIIAKRQLELKEEIQNIEVIGGGTTTVTGGITKAELEELWQKHDANAYAKFTAYLNNLHAEDIDKADEIISLMKQGNKTAQDTYTAVLNFSNKTNLSVEELRKLLKSIYDYLPNLKCKCSTSSSCSTNTTVHEGVIGNLNDLLG